MLYYLMLYMMMFVFCLLTMALLYPKQNGWQFSVRWLFALTTLVAVLLGLIAAGALSPPN